MWTTIFVSGISLGSFYVLVALGFALIFGVTRNFNLAHGELLVLAGYSAYWLWKVWALPFVFTFPVAILLILIICLLLQRLFARLRDPIELNSIVLSFGIAVLIQNIMLFCFSGDYRLIRIPILNQGLRIPGVYISYSQLTLLLLSLITLGILYLLMHRTYLGKALRATIQDKDAAALTGINVAAMGTLAFCIGAVLIGLAGPLYGCIHYLYPTTGHEATLVAITITIFAGVGRLGSIILAGWILGLAESFTVVLCGASWRELVSAVLLLTLLALRPHGILGKGER
ncbi:MAG: branched-chain amino acid ABC transporter permease [Deltaproteobacteria bacterium]|jgi:branched-chain amino acid transport system permease protein|nr:branched-chain amino acid ABC transporter permease [Deltaproteobacteria bacterium]